MPESEKTVWGMGWTHQEPAVGRHIYRWTKPGYEYHILWDGTSLWYATPYKDVCDKTYDPEKHKNYMVYARQKGCEPSPEEDEGNDYSVRMVYFPKNSVPDMLLFGRDCFEKGFAAATKEISRTVAGIDHKTQL